MYLPSAFEETRPDVLTELISSHPLGALVTLGSTGLTANHIPFLLEGPPAPGGKLSAHVARANSQWRDFSPTTEALVIFQGPQAYITPSWYETKRETGRVVPTYNYCVVHAHGPLKVIDDSEWLRAFVTRLTARHESSRPVPWQVTDAPADYIDKQLTAIVGIEISITKLAGKWKLAQNRTEADRVGVRNGLQASDTAEQRAMAARMRGKQI
ncbi:MAG TPA: FMN-binding negative transcriptional regulator [Opitutaceae bacterium]|jgi:transcriptional regulator